MNFLEFLKHKMWISEASKYTFRRRASKKSQEKKERRVLPSKEGKKSRKGGKLHAVVLSPPPVPLLSPLTAIFPLPRRDGHPRQARTGRRATESAAAAATGEGGHDAPHLPVPPRHQRLHRR